MFVYCYVFNVVLGTLATRSITVTSYFIPQDFCYWKFQVLIVTQ